MLAIVSEFPPLFNPLIVTLLTPLKSITGPATAPDIVRAPLGVIVSEVHIPAAPVKALVPYSFVASEVIVIVMFLPT